MENMFFFLIHSMVPATSMQMSRSVQFFPFTEGSQKKDRAAWMTVFNQVQNKFAQDTLFMDRAPCLSIRQDMAFMVSRMIRVVVNFCFRTKTSRFRRKENTTA